MKTISPIALSTYFISSADSFSLCHSPFARVRKHNYSLQTSLDAKPAPSLQFDLDEILDNEKSLVDITQKKNVSTDSDEEGEGDIGVEEDDSEEEIASVIKTHTIPAELNNKRIDAILAALDSTLSRSTCANLISDGNVELCGKKSSTKITKKSEKLKEGQVIQVTYPKQQDLPTEIVAQDLPLDILYEDEHMIVVNKAAGMVVHPAAGNWDSTLVNALAYYLPNKSPFGSGEFFGEDMNEDETNNKNAKDETDGETIYFRPGIVHRLDKGTTGIIVVAKTKDSLTALSSAFANREVKKTYIAITVGNPGKNVRIDKPIGRHPIQRQKMRVVPNAVHRNSNSSASRRRTTTTISNVAPSVAGRRALSYVNTQAFDGKFAVVEVRIETGRTHQIRVHLQDRQTPIYGDDIYGLPDWNGILKKRHSIERPLLHAYRLEINHPVTGEPLTFVAPMAEDMTKIANIVWPDGVEERGELFHPSILK